MAVKPGRPKKKTAKKRKYIKPGGYDFTVMFSVLTLVLFGVVMIFSSSYYYTMTSAKYEYDKKENPVYPALYLGAGRAVLCHLHLSQTARQTVCQRANPRLCEARTDRRDDGRDPRGNR